MVILEIGTSSKCCEVSLKMNNTFSSPGWVLLKGCIEVNPFSLLVNVASENLSLLKPFLTNVLILYLMAIPEI